MRVFIPYLFLLVSASVYSQTLISGQITTSKGLPIEGANIYLVGTYDGSTSDAEGKFEFYTHAAGEQSLEVSYIGFNTYQITDLVSKLSKLKIVLQTDSKSLDAVVLTGSTFSVGGDSKLSALKPLDIFTTANAVGDIMGAFQTLPGVSTVAEDGRLFVRGGDATETKIFIDGTRVFTPYTATANNTPARGRYSPALFDGISLSTGGYSAEYGQALSSVLLLNTKEAEVAERADISLMNIGGGVGYTKKWESASLSLNSFYTNLKVYDALFPDQNTWIKPYESLAGELIFRQKIGNGLLKFYTALDAADFKLTQEDINKPEGVDFFLKNLNYYANLNYNNQWNNAWDLHLGASYSKDKNNIELGEAAIKDTENGLHLKVKLKKRFHNYLKWSFGVEQFITDYNETYSESISSSTSYKTNYKDPLAGLFNELEFLPSSNLAIRIGARGEYSDLLKEFTLSPRASIAYKTGERSQVAFSYGKFYQQPEKDILKFKSNLNSIYATHYILNYQYTQGNRILKAELYRKDYSNLVRHSDAFPSPTSVFDNSGKGYAQGLDVFWRDNNSFKNLEYWVSYSYLDTKRRYKDYPKMSVPPIANTHNLSIVAKYWKSEWRSQIGFSYLYASGRTYTDYNKPGFLQNKTQSYNNLSINWSFLISQQQILYASVSNVLGFKNTSGYQYADSPAPDGTYARQSISSSMNQFFFIGYFLTISTDKKANQLKNL